MRKKRNIMIFCLCLISLALCVMLPFFISWIGDMVSKETVSYHKMKTVQLYPEVNDIQKLYLLKSETYIPISENRCKLKKADMDEILENALRNYIDTNLIRGSIKDFSLECEPFRYYSVVEANLSTTIWVIQMELWDKLGQSIVIYLDDQDGKILSISYDCLNPVYAEGTLQERIWLLSGIYLSYMEWLNADIYETNKEVVQDENYNKNKSELSYYVNDIQYGEIEIEFILTKTGFRIYMS